MALWYTHSLDIHLNVMDTTHHISYIQETKLHARKPAKYNIKLFPYYDIIFKSPMSPNQCNNHRHTPHIHVGGDLATFIITSLCHNHKQHCGSTLVWIVLPNNTNLYRSPVPKIFTLVSNTIVPIPPIILII
jgi:hypothetical protein